MSSSKSKTKDTTKRHAKMITYVSKEKDEKQDDLKKKASKLKGGDLTIQDLIGRQLATYKGWDEKSIVTDFSKTNEVALTSGLAYKTELAKVDDSHVYYNAVITNTSTTKNAIATFQEFRGDPIVDVPEDYHLSVIRFAIPGTNIPIFVASIQAGPSPYGSNSNPNLTNYSVTLSYFSDDGKSVPETVVQKYITFVPNDVSEPTPTRWDVTGVTQNSLYYSVYSYHSFLDMINTAFSSALADLITAVGGPVGVINPPELIFDPATQLISLVVEKGYIAPASTAVGYVHIYINNLLSTFMDTFDFVINGQNTANGKDLQFVVEQRINNNYTINSGPIAIGTTNTSTAITSASLFTKKMSGGIFTASGVPLNATATFNNTSSMTLSNAATATATVNATIVNNNFVIMTQESPALFLWNSIRSLVLTTGTVPIKAEYIPNSTQGSTSDNFIPILTDFEPLQSSGNDRSLIQYYPTSEYRLIDLRGATPLNTFDLQIYWQDKQQNRYPLYLPPLGSADIKFLLRKKSGEHK